ncbi:5-oxo-L-prolinase [Chondrus crispus]|uniref:5-oxo-L-prolinase n=1 Tax=Chondrus crispus TaxID=2769 RepID=R7QAC7_CHOCR|nr:5-oxo-L-prolinase [Chondrus crispus]CDF34748.1 5-oxo-L-prolinase [Chondrus crispus]|eukprot:XP_005714567.1 5-oxo-L-prolinase [Chondrus crispus]
MSTESPTPLVRVAIDRGGTFTDIYAEIDRPDPDKPDSTLSEHHVLKLLSVDPANYPDAPTEAIRRVLQLATKARISRHEPLNSSHIQWIRMGTTVATNALLEREGEACALVTSEGLQDMLAIGNQARPNIFDLKVTKMPVLYKCTVGAEERVRMIHSANHTHFGKGIQPSLKIHKPLNVEKLTKDLKRVREQGISSLAVALMHSYAFKDHEQHVKEIATNLGFSHISLSSELTPMVKIVPRGFTATVDAYLTPKIRGYIATFKAGFQNQLGGVDVQFMQSDGGLCNIDSFSGYVAILSGPAGGVVGYAKACYGYERNTPEVGLAAPPMPVIGFDMGGTSTDVSRYAGRLEHVFETETAGVTIQAPQLDINTVAAGGGSRLFYRSGMFYVGPESAGAHPGPVCYRKGGHLTVTDANLILGRIVPDLFPKIFGKNADQPLDVQATQLAFDKLTATINADLRQQNEPELSREQVAEGFIKVANEAMCRPIRQLTEAKGHDVRDHTLACFGGAGGQHACAVARSLGIKTVFVHKYSGILSAYGIALAESVVEVQEPTDILYANLSSRAEAFALLHKLKEEACATLTGRKIQPESIRFELYLNLRYEGTDFGIMVQCPENMSDRVSEVEFDSLFLDEYTREHGFNIPGRKIVVDDARVRAIGSSVASKSSESKSEYAVTVASLEVDEEENVKPRAETAEPVQLTKCFFSEDGGWLETPVWRSKELPRGRAVLCGPCLIVDTDAGITIVVDPGCAARVGSDGNVVINLLRKTSGSGAIQANTTAGGVDHIQLSIFSHRFMGIAEQMGRTLQRTSISTNIKERLDFSCALFDDTGGLVANAPHVPVHLGAMQDAVRYQIRTLGTAWKEGEVLLSNHPSAGGTHLPDITIITPVYYEDQIVFFVASRGHHADIGGATPGSMPPFSRKLEEEGLAVKSMKLVRNGLFQESEIVKRLEEAGCRCVRDVLSDLRAQVAANKKGISLVTELINEQGLTKVVSYMHHIQEAAAHAVHLMLKEISRENGLAGKEPLQFMDHMDDGTEIKLAVSIDEENGTASFDFRGSGPQVDGNTNAPRAITSSAIIYALRCMVDQDIPLNQGCLDPITMKIPESSILSPSPTAAVVGGNVLTSQRLTDVILGAFKACAASQGCMNNLTFGDETMGYYETIGGGCGAGSSWNGTSGVQCHMTNTRITDPEILERRYPAVLREFSIRKGSGGDGKYQGGDGLIRAIEFTKPMTVSVLTERRNYAPWGMAGGRDGAMGINELIHPDGARKVLGGKNSVHVDSGDIVQISTPGGGGYGESH